jgi:predicted Fe-S protein YdhL (DUF1289 family)
VNFSETPCTTNCDLDVTTVYCVKCGRSTQQIQDWLTYPSDKRKEIMKEIKAKRRSKNGLGTNN